MRRYTAILAIAALLLCAFPALTQATVRVASWNVLHLGYSNGKNLKALARVVSQFDLVGLEEVMDSRAVIDLQRTLQRQTGQEWSSAVSHEVGRSSYKEAYAFIWRHSSVSSVGGNTLYKDPGDKFAREPYSAIFRDRESGQEFVLSTVHILFGDSRADRTPEINALNEYWGWLNRSYEQPVLLAGDFNTPPGDPAWRALRSDAVPLITRGATTLSPIDGQFVSLYDNIWTAPARLNITAAGIMDFPRRLGVTHQQARDRISDHAPVFVVLGSPDSKAESIALARNPQDCIDINKASISELDRLPHIGPHYAQLIIAKRPWSNIQALASIRGLSTAYVSDIASSNLACRDL